MSIKIDLRIETKLTGANVNRKVEAAMNAFVLEAAEAMVEDSINMTPVGETGNLASMQGAFLVGPMEVEARSDAPYSEFVDQGTRYMAASPFWTPAYEKARSTYEKDAADAARKVVER